VNWSQQLDKAGAGGITGSGPLKKERLSNSTTTTICPFLYQYHNHVQQQLATEQHSDHTHLRGLRAHLPPVMRQVYGGRAVVLCLISQLAAAQVIPPLPVPTRPLEWGDVNFLSTSDTHGELVALPPRLQYMFRLRLTASRLAAGPSTCAHPYFAALSLLPVLMTPLTDHLARTGTWLSSLIQSSC
jgi:hypothetical protein